MTRFVVNLMEFMAKIAELFSAISLAFVMTILVIQVILRYVFKFTLPWVEGTARYLMIWIVMVISSVAIKEDTLIKVDFFDSYWPPKFVKYRDIIYRILIFGLFVILLQQGWAQAIYGKTETIPSLGISRFWQYVAIPVGVALMIIQYLCLTLKDLLLVLKLPKRDK